MKSNLLYIAMLLLILCVPFRGNENGIHWVWSDLPWIPLILLLTALMCIAGFLFMARKEAQKHQG